MTHDIVIPLEKKIVFPALCVVCEKENPDSEVELSFLESQFSASEAASTVLTGSTYHVEPSVHDYHNIPACKACAGRLRSHHLRLKIINYTLWTLSVVLAIFLPVSLLWKAVVFLFFLILPVIIGLIYPPAIDASISKEIATFQFTSQKFAEEFRSLNAN